MIDDILKDGESNEHFLNTSCSLLSRFIRKRIPIDNETIASVAKVRKTLGLIHRLSPKNKLPFSTPGEEAEPKTTHKITL